APPTWPLSAPDERDEPDEHDLGVAAELDRLVEVLDLPVADQHDEAVAVERVARRVRLLDPVDARRAAADEPAPRLPRALRSHEPAERVRRRRVEPRDLLPDAQP